MTQNRVVHLVDDDEAIRHSASFMLRHAGFEVKTYADGETFLDAVSSEEPGCVLLDIRMPGRDGLSVQREMAARALNLPVIILTGHGDVPLAVEAMKAGAVDFIQKPYEKSNLLSALDFGFSRLDDADDRAAAAAAAHAKLAALTNRESDVLERLTDGLTNKQIADVLDISPRTVEIHRANLMEKLGAETLADALRIAFSANLSER